MALRSTRSRSRTPFFGLNAEATHHNLEDFVEGEAYLSSEGTVMRITRSSTKVKVSSSSNNNHVSEMNKSSKMNRVVHKSRQKTSDYSSEDGDQQVSSTLVTDQNMANQFLENTRRSQSRASEYSSHSSAIDYYRAAGDYWNKYPKTDYTYSEYSKDRKEIEPGVILMPNMSRRSIHSLNGSAEEYSVLNKHTSTDFDYSSRNYKNLSSSQNNHNSELFSTTISSNKSMSFISRMSESLRVKVATIFMWIFSVFYTIFARNFITATIGRLIYVAVSSILILDTKILKKQNTYSKKRILVALCLLPLIFFAGLHVLLASGVSLVPPCHPNCGHIASSYFNTLVHRTLAAINYNYEKVSNFTFWK